jgi:hypothetical protein
VERALTRSPVTQLVHGGGGGGEEEEVYRVVLVGSAAPDISPCGMHTHVGSPIAAADRQASLDDADVL